MQEILNPPNRKILSRGGLKSLICKAVHEENWVKETINAKMHCGIDCRGTEATFKIQQDFEYRPYPLLFPLTNTVKGNSLVFFKGCNMKH